MVAANIVRMASTTMSVAKMKTCEEKMSSFGAPSVSPTPMSAKPASATPLNSSSEHEAPPPLPDVHLRRRHRQEAAALIEQHHLGADDDDQPHDRVEGRRPEHAGDGEQRVERRHGHRRAELVAHEHRQQLVLELRLDGRAGGEPRASFLEVVIGAHARIAAAVAARDVLGYGAGRHRLHA